MHGIKLLKIPITDQLGDILTKRLPKLGFEHLRKKLLWWQFSSTSMLERESQMSILILNVLFEFVWRERREDMGNHQFNHDHQHFHLNSYLLMGSLGLIVKYQMQVNRWTLYLTSQPWLSGSVFLVFSTYCIAQRTFRIYGTYTNFILNG